MTESTHELSASDRALLEAFRGHESPPPDAAQRVYTAVRARIDAGLEDDLALSEDARSRPEAPVPWVRSIALSFAIAAAVLLAMRGVVTGAAALRERAEATPSQAQHDAASARETGGEARIAKPPKPTPAPGAAPSSSDDASPTDDMAAPVVPPPPVAEPDTAPSRSPRSRVATEPADPASELAADLELLAQAKRTSDPTPRLALLQRHAETHPGSTLAEERDVLLIETLCALGRTEEASARAARFAARHPRSAFHARVSHSCARADAAGAPSR